MAKITLDKVFEGTKAAYHALTDKLGEDIVVLDITGVSSLADFFIIATGNNPNHVRAMTDHVQDVLEGAGFRTRQVEGQQSARWILLDFGDIVVHLFNKEEREFYRLEKIWGDARHYSPEELV
jgi:ribosome-associated protein